VPGLSHPDWFRRDAGCDQCYRNNLTNLCRRGQEAGDSRQTSGCEDLCKRLKLPRIPHPALGHLEPMNKLGTSAKTAVISLTLYALYSLHLLPMKPQPAGAGQTKSAGRESGVATSKGTDHNSAGIQFREIAKQAGLAGITICGGCEKRSVLEVNCGGVCWFDYNNDGVLDLFVSRVATVDDLRAIRNGQQAGQRNYLYRNNGDGTFADVTDIAGMTSLGWASGCAAADYDNDGNIDLFVSNVGENFLYKNRG